MLKYWQEPHAVIVMGDFPVLWPFTSPWTSARRAISTFGSTSFAAFTALLAGGVLREVFSSETDGPSCVVQMEIGGPSAELRGSENGLYSARF